MHVIAGRLAHRHNGHAAAILIQTPDAGVFANSCQELSKAGDALESIEDRAFDSIHLADVREVAGMSGLDLAWLHIQNEGQVGDHAFAFAR